MIFYSHVNEDNIVEKYCMNQTSFQNLVCISGSGERVLALMDHSSLNQLFVIDSNIEALHLMELKLKALEKLSLKNYLEFIGINPSKNRVPTFEFLKSELSNASHIFWENRVSSIKKGVVHIGHFEQFLARFRPFFKVFLGKSFYRCFEKDFTEIDDFPHWRWQLLKRIYAQDWAFKLGGSKDIAFISDDANQALIPNGLLISDAIQNTLSETGKAILLTSIILFGGFFILIHSDFWDVYVHGILVSLMLFFALMTDLFLLPVLLYKFKKSKP